MTTERNIAMNPVLGMGYDLSFTQYTGHKRHRLNTQREMALVLEYDPTDDGPECEVITRISGSHQLYRIGTEKELLRLQILLNKIARQMFGRHYYALGKKRQERVRKKVILACVSQA